MHSFRKPPTSEVSFHLHNDTRTLAKSPARARHLYAHYLDGYNNSDLRLTCSRRHRRLKFARV